MSSIKALSIQMKFDVNFQRDKIRWDKSRWDKREEYNWC
jgi:hypothetical protein